MASSKASTVQQYLDELPQDRRAVVSAVRDVVVRNLPPGYRETMNWGMISYELPLEDYPNTYNNQPLSYAGLAAQKNHYALYLLGVTMQPEQLAWLREEFGRAGKKMDMGRSCLRFRKLDDLPLDAIGTVIAGMPPEQLVARYEKVRGEYAASKAAR